MLARIMDSTGGILIDELDRIGRMIQTPEQPINITLPENSVRMLIAQPFLEFPASDTRTLYALLPDCAARMLAGIDRVFAVAGTFGPHFIVFPEFSLPGVSQASDPWRLHLSSIGAPTIVIAGVSGLSAQPYGPRPSSQTL